MIRTSLQDVAGLPDPLLSYNFDLMFPRIPGATGDVRGMTIKCMTTSLPGMQLEQVTASLHGVEVSFAGRQIYSKTFQATFYEARDCGSRQAIRQWIEYARNNRRNAGNYKSQYAVGAMMYLYDDIPNVINETKIVNCFPTAMDDLSMDGGQGQLVQLQCTFSYDWTEESLVDGQSSIQ